MSSPSLDNMDVASLRAFALDAWRRAEAQERRAQVEAKRAQVEAKRAQTLTEDMDLLTEENTTLNLKASALETEVTVLLKRISKLTRMLATATHRDVQLELELELRRIKEQLAAANNERFGTRSERRDRPEGAEDKKKEKKDKKGHGPTPQPKLPIEEVIHHLDDADCCCPKCGDDLRKMANQFEETELISSVKVRYVLQLHKQQKYRCGGCGHIDTALGPLRLIPGGRYDLPFTVQVALAKFLDHLPIERQVTRMGRRGLQVTGQTLWDQLFALYVVLLPTLVALQDQVLAEPLIFADETTWRVMGKGGKRRSAKWWLWTLAGAQAVYFEILPTRGSAAARHILRDYDGVIMADGYTVYRSLEKALDKAGGVQIDLETGEPQLLTNYLLAGCWMHARRPFFRAETSAPEAGYALDLIAKLYAIEARAREEADGDLVLLLERRRILRDAESQPLIEELKLWRDAQRSLPGTKFHDGLTFLKNQWVPLTRFLEDPQIPLDNGEAERRIRGPVVGRKNFAGSQSERGTRVAALFYSLLQSAVRTGVDPHAYLMEAAERALKNPGSVLLPRDFASEELATASE